jgi:hypothetical protein
VAIEMPPLRGFEMHASEVSQFVLDKFGELYEKSPRYCLAGSSRIRHLLVSGLEY